MIEFYPSFESALQEGDISDEVKDFILEDLNAAYETMQELREDINPISFPKKKILL